MGGGRLGASGSYVFEPRPAERVFLGDGRGIVRMTEGRDAMTVQDIGRIQQELTPKDDLSAYQDRWVALRDGHVIASADDPAGLRANPDVELTDGIVYVGEPTEGYFL